MAVMECRRLASANITLRLLVGLALFGAFVPALHGCRWFRRERTPEEDVAVKICEGGWGKEPMYRSTAARRLARGALRCEPRAVEEVVALSGRFGVACEHIRRCDDLRAIQRLVCSKDGAASPACSSSTYIPPELAPSADPQ